jgi:hypothetical protein
VTPVSLNHTNPRFHASHGGKAELPHCEDVGTLAVEGISVDKVRGVSPSSSLESAWAMYLNPDSEPYPTFREFRDLLASDTLVQRTYRRGLRQLLEDSDLEQEP